MNAPVFAPPMRIALWNTAFLGDAVLTLPLIRAVKERFPGAELDFYVRQGFSGLFEGHPDIAHVYAMDKNARSVANLPALGKLLSGRGYALWVCAHPSFRSALVCRLSGAAMRVGYSELPLARLFFTHSVSRRFSDLDEIERLLQLMIPLEPAAPQVTMRIEAAFSPLLSKEEQHWPELGLPAKAREEAALFYEGLRGGSAASEHQASTDTDHAKTATPPVLGVHPGSVWPTKRWPVEYFAELCTKALHHGAHVLVFAGPGEEGVAQRMLDSIDTAGGDCSARVHDLSGKLGLAGLAAHIGGLSCYVTNDSGPMHLAWAQRVPVTALFGPTTRQLGFFPRGRGATVMELPLDCRPCGLHGHRECPKGHHNCMRALTPDMVWADVANKLWPDGNLPAPAP